jgi:hypothetical protein
MFHSGASGSAAGYFFHHPLKFLIKTLLVSVIYMMFVSTLNKRTIRVLLSLAASHGLLIHQMDVKTTFLNGELEEEIYMDQSDGFVVKGQEGMACKLLKSLYGLKQALSSGMRSSIRL